MRRSIVSAKTSVADSMSTPTTNDVEHAVDNEMLQDESMLRDLVREEGLQQDIPIELSIDEMNKVYDEITQELYQALAQ